MRMVYIRIASVARQAESVARQATHHAQRTPIISQVIGRVCRASDGLLGSFASTLNCPCSELTGKRVKDHGGTMAAFQRNLKKILESVDLKWISLLNMWNKVA